MVRPSHCSLPSNLFWIKTQQDIPPTKLTIEHGGKCWKNSGFGGYHILRYFNFIYGILWTCFFNDCPLFSDDLCHGQKDGMNGLWSSIPHSSGEICGNLPDDHCAGQVLYDPTPVLTMAYDYYHFFNVMVRHVSSCFSESTPKWWSWVIINSVAPNTPGTRGDFWGLFFWLNMEVKWPSFRYIPP